MVRLRAIAALLCLLPVGCSSTSRTSADGLILFVPGVGGDGGWYRNVVPALRDAGEQRTVESFTWGVPGPGFFLNFNNAGIHDRAEKALAERIVAYRREHPTSPLDLLAHSAGGGVTLGALGRLPADVHVRRVVLLAPSVSPTYPLEPALARVDDHLDVFASDHDTTFLDWRTSHFGTYDNIKTQAAGNCGFDLSNLSPESRARVTQLAWSASRDASAGNDGGHFGALAKSFFETHVAPLFVRQTR